MTCLNLQKNVLTFPVFFGQERCLGQQQYPRLANQYPQSLVKATQVQTYIVQPHTGFHNLATLSWSKRQTTSGFVHGGGRVGAGHGRVGVLHGMVGHGREGVGQGMQGISGHGYCMAWHGRGMAW